MQHYDLRLSPLVWLKQRLHRPTVVANIDLLSPGKGCTGVADSRNIWQTEIEISNALRQRGYLATPCAATQRAIDDHFLQLKTVYLNF